MSTRRNKNTTKVVIVIKVSSLKISRTSGFVDSLSRYALATEKSVSISNRMTKA